MKWRTAKSRSPDWVRVSSGPSFSRKLPETKNHLIVLTMANQCLSPKRWLRWSMVSFHLRRTSKFTTWSYDLSGKWHDLTPDKNYLIFFWIDVKNWKLAIPSRLLFYTWNWRNVLKATLNETRRNIRSIIYPLGKKEKSTIISLKQSGRKENKSGGKRQDKMDKDVRRHEAFNIT